MSPSDGVRHTPLRLGVATLVALGLAAGPAFAIDPATDILKYSLHLWRDTSGLPQNNVKAIHQTRDGYLWVGTKGGLARFDGVRFTVFDDVQPGALPELEVWAIVEDPAGALWVGTFGGGVSRYKDGVFTTYTAKDGLASDFVTALTVGPDGALWVGTDSRGISRIHEGRVESFGRSDGLIDDHIRALHTDARGTIWAGTAKGLGSFDGTRFVPHPLALSVDSRVVSITEAPGGGLWVATARDGLYRFDGSFHRHVGDRAVTHPELTALGRDKSGTLWIGSQEGLCRLREGRTSCYYPRVDLVSNNILQSIAVSQIQAVVEDREGNLWVGTSGEGLAVLRDTQFLNYGASDGLVAEGGLAVLAARNGSIWVGTFDRLAQFENGRFTLHGEAGLAVRSLLEDEDGSIWVGGSRGLHVMRGGVLRPVPLSGVAPAPVSAILRDGRGDLWVGIDGEGVVQLHGGEVRRYGTTEGLPGLLIRGIVEDPEGTIWFGLKEHGVLRWRDGAFSRLTTADGLPSDAVQSLQRDGEAIWIGTRRGLARWTAKTGLVTYTAANGLPTNYVYHVIRDAQGDLWLTCGRGIFRIAAADVEALTAGRVSSVPTVPYGADTGLRGGALPVGGQWPVARSPDGRLWFMTLKGLSTIDPGRTVEETLRAPTLVERALADGKTVVAGETIPPDPGQLDIEYTAFCFFAPERVKFRYRLRGFDSDWVDAGSRRRATYTRMPPGAYTFEVASRIGAGPWGEPVTWPLVVAPHFHERRSFQAAALLAAALLLGALYRMRMLQMKREKERLQKRIDDAIDSIQVLSGLLPVCSWCHKVREDTGYWGQLEAYVAAHSSAQFSHGVCPDCLRKHYPQLANRRAETGRAG